MPRPSCEPFGRLPRASPQRRGEVTFFPLWTGNEAFPERWRVSPQNYRPRRSSSPLAGRSQSGYAGCHPFPCWARVSLLNKLGLCSINPLRMLGAGGKQSPFLSSLSAPLLFLFPALQREERKRTRRTNSWSDASRTVIKMATVKTRGICLQRRA